MLRILGSTLERNLEEAKLDLRVFRLVKRVELVQSLNGGGEVRLVLTKLVKEDTQLGGREVRDILGRKLAKVIVTSLVPPVGKLKALVVSE